MKRPHARFPGGGTATKLGFWPFALVLLLAACSVTDSPTTAPPDSEQSFVEPVGTGRIDLDPVVPFSLELDMQGSSGLREPIDLLVTATGLIDISDVELRVTAPEAAAAELRGWGEPYAVPVGQPLPTLRTDRWSLAGGQQRTVSVSTLRIDEPGIYQVVATLTIRGPEFEQAPGHMLDAVHERLWLLVTEDGIATSRIFPGDAVPDGAIAAPGPFRTKGARLPLSPSGGPSGAASLIGGFIQYQALYYNQTDGEYDPVPNAAYEIKYCNYGMGFLCNQIAGSTSGYTNTNGHLQFDCTADDGYFGEGQTTNIYIGVSPGGVIGMDGDMTPDCGNSFQAYFQSDRTRVFVNASQAALGTTDLFNQTRSHIMFKLSTSANNSFYSSGNDDITIKSPAHIWGQGGIRTAAHEYGHAFHEKALGGNEGGSCPSPHFFNMAHNLQCAFSEGFANYVSAAVRPDVSPFAFRDNIEDNDYYPGCVYLGEFCAGESTDGAVIEGAVAAFFYDLTDPDTETNDGVEFPGSYVADIIETCLVKEGLFWRRADGVDHLIYCFEKQVDSAVTSSGTYFPTRGTDPSQQNESASEPTGWSAGAVRALWTWNLYGES